MSNGGVGRNFRMKRLEELAGDLAIPQKEKESLISNSLKGAEDLPEQGDASSRGGTHKYTKEKKKRK